MFCQRDPNDSYSLSISTDFDKHNDLLLDANLLIEDPNKKIKYLELKI